MKKPKNHCKCGTWDHAVPVPIDGRVRYIDLCIADIIAALNAANIKTMASCCGHGKMQGRISLKDGRDLILVSYEEAQKMFAAD